jgi:Flp pilus assembly protein TadD
MGRFVEAEVVAQALLSDCEALAAENRTRARALIHRAWALARLAQVCSDRENEAAVKLIWRQAVASADRAADEFPKTAMALAGAAWFFSMCSNPACRDSEKALRLAERAARLEPDSPDVARTLGLAHLRAGDGDAAVESLQRARRLFRQRDLVTDLLLAMALAESGRLRTARGEFEQVCRRIVEARDHSEDIERLRAEAESIFAVRK